MKIPFVDLKAQYATIRGEIEPVVADVLESTQFIGGARVAAFEGNFAKYVEARYGVGTSSGTSALHLALEAIGIDEGDEVITACNTFIATTAAISQSGARPVLVDINPETMNLDPQKVEDAITPRTRAIVPVHLYGQPADMRAIRTIAEKHNLKIVTDAAQAHGARFEDSRREIHGLLSAYSFYPGKNLGAYGDAGMVTTDDEDLVDRMRMLLDHGRQGKYLHKEEGYNYRLDAFQASILDVKLRHLDQWTEARRSRARRYDAAFADSPVRPVQEDPRCYHVYHLYVVRVKNRDDVMKALSEKGIATGIHYPVPLHLQEAYRYLGIERGAFPIAEEVADEILSLPMYAELTDAMVDEVAVALKDVVA